MNEKIEKCSGGKHSLIAVSNKMGSFCGEIEVVQWCEGCGAIVIDSMVDGRVYPGRIMPMIFPQVTKNLVK